MGLPTLKIELFNKTIGWLNFNAEDGYIFYPNPSYDLRKDPTFSLSVFSTETPTAPILYRQISKGALPPLFSNLLPFGLRRQLAIRTIRKKEHKANELALLQILSEDLPGLYKISKTTSEEIEIAPESLKNIQKFSLDDHPTRPTPACQTRQMSFAMTRKGASFTLPKPHQQGEYVARLPEKDCPELVEAEYASFELAYAIGINVSASNLVPLMNLDLKLPKTIHKSGPKALILSRQDITPEGKPYHIESFYQALNLPKFSEIQQKDVIKLVALIQFFGYHPEQMILNLFKQILLHFLLGGTETGFENYYFRYRDRKSPEICPIQSFFPSFICKDAPLHQTALWKGLSSQDISLQNFKEFCDGTTLNWVKIESELQQIITKARSTWPQRLEELSIAPLLKEKFYSYWQTLHSDFAITRT